MAKRRTKACTPWARTRKASGATLIERSCGTVKADIVSGGSYYTYNVKTDKGAFIKRGSARKLQTAKTLATRVMRKKR
jgi:hypothetical protein